MTITRKSMLFAGAAAAGLMLAAVAEAQTPNTQNPNTQTPNTQTKTFDLPAEPAVKGIPDFAAQAGIQIIAPAGSLKGLQTQAVQGQVDLHAALARLIDGTGLEVASDTPSLIVLRVKTAGMPNDPQPGATQAAATQATGAAGDSTTVVVTGSRLASRGFKAPTPVTVVDSQELKLSGAQNLDVMLTDTPQFTLSLIHI